MAEQRAINKVDIETLSLALRVVGIQIDEQTLGKIINLIKLIEEKGREVTIDDICLLESVWEKFVTDDLRVTC